MKLATNATKSAKIKKYANMIQHMTKGFNLQYDAQQLADEAADWGA